MLEPLFSKVPGLKACKCFKRRLQHICFLVNIAKFLKIAFFIEHLRWLLLYICKSNFLQFDNGNWSGEKNRLVRLEPNSVGKLESNHYTGANFQRCMYDF